MHCDKHLTKMLVETTQLLCFAHHLSNPDKEWIDRNELYAFNKSHGNHPCTQWLLRDNRNYNWAHELLASMIDEYDYRYGGRDKYINPRRLLPLLEQPPTGNVDRRAPDTFALAMNANPECKGDYADESYRRFYVVGKREFAHWNNKRKAPRWYVDACQQFDELGDIRLVSVM